MDESTKLDALLAGFPIVVVLPVQWGEQDSFGHVNHVVYFRWYESSRIAYAQKVGLMDLHGVERIGPILASVSNDYRRQLTFPDAVHVGVRVTRIRTSGQGARRMAAMPNSTDAARPQEMPSTPSSVLLVAGTHCAFPPRIT